MRIAYFEAFAGASGNMILGALIDAGLELESLIEGLKTLPIGGYSITASRVKKRGIAGTFVEVKVTEPQEERGLPEIEEIIMRSSLPEKVKALSLRVFRRLAEAEARVHDIPVEKVHFHEVGAVDAIVDVVGSILGLELLGVEEVYVSPLHLGYGMVKGAHGPLPVPAPATMELVRGVPVYGWDVEAELLTPTGAAILTTLARSFGSPPPFKVEKVGYGAGLWDLPFPNLLRLCIGVREEEIAGYEEDYVTVLEANIDDMNPQWFENLLEKLMEAGALDVYLTPLQMKKGRPGVKLGVLLKDEKLAPVLDTIFAESTTIGVRAYRAKRWKLEREEVPVLTPFGEIRVKVARKGGQILNLAPEYEDCRKVAKEMGLPVKEIYQIALEEARRKLKGELSAGIQSAPVPSRRV
ncbi:MAG: nickel pincer cofactor biosynthesis protein LarC [Anaerolineae bacterium]|nr:nickel pincer cofactor biosynthesis protein LarC [Anaerolineae bacterium]